MCPICGGNLLLMKRVGYRGYYKQCEACKRVWKVAFADSPIRMDLRVG